MYYPQPVECDCGVRLLPDIEHARAGHITCPRCHVMVAVKTGEIGYRGSGDTMPFKDSRMVFPLRGATW